MFPIEQFLASFGTTSNQGFRVKLHAGKKIWNNLKEPDHKKVIFNVTLAPLYK